MSVRQETEKTANGDTVTIPPQLREEEFILNSPSSKRPIHAFKNGPDAKRYKWSDELEREVIKHHLRKPSPVSVYLQDGLTVLDVEKEGLEHETVAVLLERLPATFTVESGGGGLHFYYRVPGYDEQHGLTMDSEHVADIKAPGKGYALIPPSPHPSGNRYTVKHDKPITETSEKAFRRWLHPLGIKTLAEKREEQREREAREFFRAARRATKTPSTKTNERGLDVEEVKAALPRLSTLVGHSGHGPHPVHGSTTGQNLHVQDEKGWFCHRCNGGGHALEWIAVENGIVECGEHLEGKEFREALDKAAEIAGVKP